MVSTNGGLSGKIDQLLSSRADGADVGPMQVGSPPDELRMGAMTAQIKEILASTKAMQATIEAVSRSPT